MTDQLREAFEEMERQDFTGVTAGRKGAAMLVIHAAARAWLEFPAPKAIEAAASTFAALEEQEISYNEAIHAALVAAREADFGKDEPS